MEKLSRQYDDVSLSYLFRRGHFSCRLPPDIVVLYVGQSILGSNFPGEREHDGR